MLLHFALAAPSVAAGRPVCRAKLDAAQSRLEKATQIWRRIRKLEIKAVELEDSSDRYDLEEDWQKLKKAQRRLDTVYSEIKACRRFLPPCQPENSVLRIEIENDSNVDIEIQKLGSEGMYYAIGHALYHQSAQIEIRHTALAYYGRPNSFRFYATFGGDSIVDPNIRTEIMRRYVTAPPLNKSCRTSWKIRFTDRSFAPKTGIIVRPDSFGDVTTENWEGRYDCEGPPTNTCGYGTQIGSTPLLTITGSGKGSALSAVYAVACNGSAFESYTILGMTSNSASGTYLYSDHNPAVGPTGQSGVWPGTFGITLDEKGLTLVRQDQASGWQGTYRCQR
jgi:hypothetical protein